MDTASQIAKARVVARKARAAALQSRENGDDPSVTRRLMWASYQADRAYERLDRVSTEPVREAFLAFRRAQREAQA